MKKFFLGLMIVVIGMIGVNFAQEYILFYGNGCPHCAKVEKYIADNQLLDIFDLTLKEIYFNRDNLNELQRYLQKLNLDTHQIGVPFLVINTTGECSYINGDTAIITFFQKKLELLKASENNVACNTGTCVGLNCEQQTLPELQPIVKNILQNVSDAQQSSPSDKWKFFAIMLPAAISDSINPCAFAVMLLLLSAILSRHQSRKRTLLAGGLFSLAVFLSYLAMGLGIFSALATASNTFILKLIVGILGILVGLANFKDYFWYGKWFVMEVPMSWRPKLQDIIHKVSSPIGAFFVGILVSLFLLPCSSGPYFTILGFLSSQSKELHARGLLYLIVYNLIFVLPMLLIAVLVAFGWASVDKLAKIKHENTRLIHLIVGILMVGLGVYVLTTL